MRVYIYIGICMYMEKYAGDNGGSSPECVLIRKCFVVAF